MRDYFGVPADKIKIEREVGTSGIFLAYGDDGNVIGAIYDGSISRPSGKMVVGILAATVGLHAESGVDVFSAAYVFGTEQALRVLTAVDTLDP